MQYYGTVTVIGEPDPVAAGRTGDVGVARSLAELALGAYVANRSELSSTDDLGPLYRQSVSRTPWPPHQP